MFMVTHDGFDQYGPHVPTSLFTLSIFRKVLVVFKYGLREAKAALPSFLERRNASEFQPSQSTYPRRLQTLSRH